MKSGGPEPVRENDDAGSFGTIVLRADETAENGMQAHDFEIGPADNAGLNLARLTETDHRKADGREIAELTNAARAGLNVLQFRDRKISIGAANAGSALANINEVIFVAVDQRAQQNAANQREDSRVGANTERQRENHGDRQPFCAQERAYGDFQILQEQRGFEIHRSISLIQPCEIQIRLPE